MQEPVLRIELRLLVYKTSGLPLSYTGVAVRPALPRLAVQQNSEHGDFLRDLMGLNHAGLTKTPLPILTMLRKSNYVTRLDGWAY